MKKRILSLALVLMLCLSLLPMAALAAEDEPTPKPVEATGEIVAEPTPEPTPEPVALEGASAETSESTDEPSVQSMDEPQVAFEGDITTAIAEMTKGDVTQTIYTENALVDALVDAQTSKITLQQNVTINDLNDTSVNSLLVESSGLTLDLNGHTLTIALPFYVGKNANTPTPAARLTITDSSTGAAGKLQISNNCLTVNSGSTLNINSGKLEVTDIGINKGFIYVYGAMNISGTARVSCYCLAVGDTEQQVDGSLTVTGGTIQGDVFVNTGDVSLSGGTFNGEIKGIDLAECLADGYAFFEKESQAADEYTKLTKPQTDSGYQSVGGVQVKAHTCTLEADTTTGLLSCTKDGGCGRSGLQEAVEYIDANGDEKKCTKYTLVTSSTTQWNAGWYVVNSDVTITGTVTLSGNVNLILCDGAELTINGAIDEKRNIASLTVYGQSGGNGTLTVNAPNSSTTSKAIVTSSLTVNGGTVTANAGNVTSNNSSAYSFGIYVTTLTVNGGELTATAGTATSTIDDAESYGIQANNTVTVSGRGKLTGTAGTATGEGRTESCGIYLPSGNLTVSGGMVTGTAGSATSTSGSAYSEGIDADSLTVTGGTVTATGGDAETDSDIYVWETMTLSGGTVQSGREGGAVSVYASYTLNVSGGTMKLGEGTAFYDLIPTESVKLSDLLADGCAYWKVEHKYDTTADAYKYTPVGFVTLDGLTKLEDEYDSVAYTWYEYYVKPCTHSTDDGVCAYCGKSVGDASAPGSDAEPAPTVTPAPTAAPTATPAPKAPNTADEANGILWLALAMLSMMAVVVVARKKAR